VATTTKTNATLGRLQVGYGLISFTILLIALGITIGWYLIEDVGPRIVVVVLFVAAIGVLWTAALRNGRFEREARDRLRAEHPGALVERVRVWALPHGRLEKDTPIQFLIADASEITIETITQTVLVRIPVPELGLIDLVTAQHDRAKDKALTLIYGDEQNVVQLFTITYSANDRLGARLRTAIGWPATGAP
jgi:hypothetical protein